MTKESKAAIVLLSILSAIAIFIYLHWNGLLNPNAPPMKVGTCMTYDEEFLDMSSVQRIERVGKTQIQVSYVCSYAITKALYTKNKSLIRRYYVEVPCECKE